VVKGRSGSLCSREEFVVVQKTAAELDAARRSRLFLQFSQSLGSEEFVEFFRQVAGVKVELLVQRATALV
jgi:hypothetical protein